MDNKKAVEVLDRAIAAERELVELLSDDGLSITVKDEILRTLLVRAASLLHSTLMVKIKLGSLTQEQAEWFKDHAMLILRRLSSSFGRQESKES